MLSFRYLIGVSGGVSVLMMGGWQVNAQSIPDTAPNASNFPDLSNLQVSQPKVVDLKNWEISQENQEDVSQNLEFPPANPNIPQFNEPSPENKPDPENIPEEANPNPNPLLFPTRPGEVDITRVEPVTLEQTLAIALQTNKDLQAARLRLEERQAQLMAVRSLLFPTIDFNTQFSRDSSQNIKLGNINARRLEQETTDPRSTNMSGQIQLNYDVYTGGERSARIERAETEVRQQQLEVERILEQLRADVTQSYYNLQDADARVAIAQAAIEDTTQSLRDAQLLENAGLGTRFDTLRAEVDLARANQALTTAIGDQRTARRQLAALLGIGQHIELTAADEIQETGEWPLTLEQSIVQAYKNRAELEQQLLERQISEQDREIALSAIKPTVGVAANWSYSDNFDNDLPGANGYSFRGLLQWRLFDGGRAFAEARQANRNIDIANTNFANQREQIRLQVEEAYFSMISNKENIGTTRKNVQLAEESLRLARLRFQAGVGTQTDVINSQRDLTDARSEFLQAVITYNQSLNALQRAVSNLPDNHLFEKP